MSFYVNGNSARCKQCAYYRADDHHKQGQWWDGFCYNKDHCKTHKVKCPAKVIGDLMACFDAEPPDPDQIQMEVE